MKWILIFMIILSLSYTVSESSTGFKQNEFKDLEYSKQKIYLDPSKPIIIYRM